MTVIRLLAETILDRETEALFARLSMHELTTQNHTHDFYEFFLVLKGEIRHMINGEMLLLSEGMLVFIRPDDQHFYQRDKNTECQIINLAFFAHTMDSVFTYLGREQWSDILLMPASPPTVQLNVTQKNILETRLEALNALPRTHKELIRLTLRSLLIDMCVNYFFNRAEPTVSPVWLTELCTAMRLPDHFIVGRNRLIELANRSPEHVGRAFKKYLGITPSQYVNTLRLNYAANLLVHTDRTIIEVALESGFENISHFNHLFKICFQTTPRHFRITHSRRIVP